MVNKKSILALSVTVLGLCGTSAAMVGPVITAQGPQDQSAASAVPADVPENKPRRTIQMPKHVMEICCILRAKQISEREILKIIVEFSGTQCAKDAFSEFKSHEKEFNLDLASKHSVGLSREIKSKFQQLQAIYNKLANLDLCSVVDAITPVEIEVVLQSINVYDHGNLRVSAIRDMRKIAASILKVN